MMTFHGGRLGRSEVSIILDGVGKTTTHYLPLLFLLISYYGRLLLWTLFGDLSSTKHLFLIDSFFFLFCNPDMMPLPDSKPGVSFFFFLIYFHSVLRHTLHLLEKLVIVHVQFGVLRFILNSSGAKSYLQRKYTQKNTMPRCRDAFFTLDWISWR